MAFTSLTYCIFLLCVFFLFLIVGNRYRWIVLVLSSYIFYGFIHNPALLIVLMAVTLISYTFGKLIYNTQHESSRKKLLWLGITVNLSLLLYFKYLPFIVQNIDSVLNALSLSIAVPVPTVQVSIALSFFIFSSISYLADIYLGTAKPEPNLGHLALYISFFPKLLQGPIERANDFLPQIKKTYQFSWPRIRSGLLLFLWGFLQKVLIADRLGVIVDPVYADVHSYGSVSLLIATYCWVFQIYYDFAGYTNMALGIAGIFDIQLTQNFNRPYLATSVADFWRRWHISLSRWILDYIFQPLQMHWREWGTKGTMAALLVTFLVIGIWHGASWGYVVFGGLHGVYMSVGMLWKPFQKKIYKHFGLKKSGSIRVWQIVFTFHLVCFALIFFRCSAIADALYIIQQLGGNLWGDLSRITAAKGMYFQSVIVTQPAGEFILTLCLMVLCCAFSAIERSQKFDAVQIGGFSWLSKVPFPIRACIYAVLFYMFAFHGANTQSFIYLQF